MAELPLKVLLVTVSVPVLKMPPPRPLHGDAELPQMVLLVTVSVPSVVDAAAEGVEGSVTEPFVIVSQSTVTSAPAPI